MLNGLILFQLRCNIMGYRCTQVDYPVTLHCFQVKGPLNPVDSTLLPSKGAAASRLAAAASRLAALRSLKWMVRAHLPYLG